jgi:HAD superfamily hydrolase (TIGR01490 family)
MNLALFDFDGTITFGDTFTPFVHFAVERRRLVTGTLALSPMILGYKLGVISAPRMRRGIVRAAFRGMREDDVRALGLRYSRQVISGVVRPQALERIEWHKAEGDVVVVVSASLDVYLSDWCQKLGVGLICSQLEATAGVMTGRYLGADCAGEEKAKRVREAYDTRAYPIVYAYGDTDEDRALLHLAHKRYFRWQEVTV